LQNIIYNIHYSSLSMSSVTPICSILLIALAAVSCYPAGNFSDDAAHPTMEGFVPLPTQAPRRFRVTGQYVQGTAEPQPWVTAAARRSQVTGQYVQGTAEPQPWVTAAARRSQVTGQYVQDNASFVPSFTESW
jgi:hypothetical protein